MTAGRRGSSLLLAVMALLLLVPRPALACTCAVGPSSDPSRAVVTVQLTGGEVDARLLVLHDGSTRGLPRTIPARGGNTGGCGLGTSRGDVVAVRLDGPDRPGTCSTIDHEAALALLPWHRAATVRVVATVVSHPVLTSTVVVAAAAYATGRWLDRRAAGAPRPVAGDPATD